MVSFLSKKTQDRTSVCPLADHGLAQAVLWSRTAIAKALVGAFSGTEFLQASLRCRTCDWRLQWTLAFTKHFGCLFRYLAWCSGSRPSGLLSAD